jgi:predicted permease
VSLGCGRARLIRQFVTESSILAALGGLLSLAVAYGTANFAIGLIPRENGPLRLSFEIDAWTMLATLGVTAMTVLVFGLYPAWRATRVDAAPALKEGSGSVGGASHSWWTPGKLLVLGQVALGVLLVAAAATFTSHLSKLVNANTGFDRSRLLLIDLKPGQSGYEGQRLRQFYLDLERKLRELPGVEAAGLANTRPMTGGGMWDQIRMEGATKGINTAVNYVTADFLPALGIRILVGRGFASEDVRNNANVVIVSEELAREIGPQALGTRFKFDDRTHEIVGIAKSARYSDMATQPNVLYWPHPLKRDSLTAVVRTAVAPMQVLDSVRQSVRELNPDLPLVAPMSMDVQIARTLMRERLFAWLCGSFGVLALLLCVVGLYGVMSYAASRRRQEIGIRMALGATRNDVLRQVVGEGMALAAVGLLLGAPAAYWLSSKYIDYQDLGMDPLALSTIAWAVAALGISALAAVLAPALRASSDDPVQALRQG